MVEYLAPKELPFSSDKVWFALALYLLGGR
jgi:hypothetical protein